MFIINLTILECKYFTEGTIATNLEHNKSNHIGM